MVPADSRKISRVPRYSGAGLGGSVTSPTGLSPAMALLSRRFGCVAPVPSAPVLQPRILHCYNFGLGFCAFARHYLHNHFCFLFLRVLRCFSSPGSPHALHGDAIARIGLPHSEIRGSCGYLPLTTAYRSLSRPSSPPRAQASFMCPSLLSFFLK